MVHLSHGKKAKQFGHFRSKAEFAKADSQDDVEKLFAFFEEMKNENENFFFDVDVGTDDDGKKIIRNIFWTMLAARLHTQILVTTSHLTPHTK